MRNSDLGYGRGSTNTSVAAALRDAINADSGYAVTAFLSGSTISVTAKTAGASTNYSLSAGSSTSQPGSFAQPSFTVATSGSALVGGSEGGSTSAATAIYLHTDHLGSTRVCTNSNGNSTGTCDYEPFGEVQPGTTCSVPTNFRFAGMEWDANAGPNGLYHTWFRQYDHNQGRWMSADPMAGHADIPQSRNRYAGLLNDPVNLTDPFGLDVFLMIGNCIWRAVVSVATVSIEGGEEGPPGITITLVERVVCEGGLTGDEIATETVDPGKDLINPFGRDVLAEVYRRTRFVPDAVEVGVCIAGGMVLGDEEVFSPLATHVAFNKVEDVLENPTTATAGARAYYGLTDKRFTRWGKFSKVLVPRAAKAAHPVLMRTALARISHQK